MMEAVMTECNLTSICQMKGTSSCSGDCFRRGQNAAHVWVVAACDGRIALYAKDDAGKLSVLRQQEHVISPSIDAFRIFIESGIENTKFDQLLVVGAASDIAWLEAYLPEKAQKFIVAEIQYPLLPKWFHQEGEVAQLTNVLQNLFIGSA